MAEVNTLSTEDRVAIDRVFERLSGRTHYEVLALSPESSWEEIDQAVRDLRRRVDASRFVGQPSEEYQRRIEHVQRALSQAVEVLSDPVRRFLYDQQLRRGEGRRAETPLQPRPAATPIPARPQGVSPRVERASASPSPMPSTPPVDSPLVVPAPFRKDVGAPGSLRPPANSRTSHSRPSVVPPPLDAPLRSASGSVVPPAMTTAATHDRRDLDTLLVEVERIAVSAQFCIAQLLDPQASRVLALQSAGQALAETRATLALLQARRDEESGRWPEAAANLLRAARAKPQDADVLARLAECQQRIGELAAAEDSARRALAIDPACAQAQTVLASLGRR